MADRDSVEAYLLEKSWRRIYPNDPIHKIVERLVTEGRAVRLSANRYAATKRVDQRLHRNHARDDQER